MNDTLNADKEIEYLNTHDRGGQIVHEGVPREILLQMARKEYRDTGQAAPFAFDICYLMLGTRNGLFTIQQRSMTDEDAGLWDHTIGGHIQAGESPDNGLERETREESGIPKIIITESDEQYQDLVRGDIDTVPVVRSMSKQVWRVTEKRLQDGTTYKKSTRVWIYEGRYDGEYHLKKADGEVRGHDHLSLVELIRAIDRSHASFTEDLRLLIRDPDYYNFFRPIK